jgi:hypothetical protein
MSQFAAHGYYKLGWRGDVLKIVVSDLFNREGAEHLILEINRMLAQRGATAWGMLLDAREWQGGTPDAFELWLASLEGWILHQGLVAFSTLYAESIQLFMGSTVRARLSPQLPFFSALDEAVCWQWLGEQGLELGGAG